jgi:hypothetical protein
MSLPRIRTAVLAALALALTSGCGRSSTAPTSSATPPSVVEVPPSVPATFTVSGVVTDATSGGMLPNISIRISGPALDASAWTDAAGRYAITGIAAGAVTLEASAAGYQTATRPVSVTGNVAVDFVLTRAVPPPQLALTYLAGASAPYRFTVTGLTPSGRVKFFVKNADHPGGDQFADNPIDAGGGAHQDVSMKPGVAEVWAVDVTTGVESNHLIVNVS